MTITPPRARRRAAVADALAPSTPSFWDRLAVSQDDPAALTEIITRQVAEVIGEGSVLALISGDGQLLTPTAIFHPDPEILRFTKQVLDAESYRLGEGIAGRVAADRTPIVLGHLEPAAVTALIHQGSTAFTERHAIKALMIVPLIADGEVLGTLGAFRIESDVPYSRADQTTLESLAERAAIALAEVNAPVRQLGPADHAAIYRHSIDGVLFTAPDGRVLGANPAACAILQMSEADICRAGRAGLVLGDDPRAQAAVAQRRDAGHVRAEIQMRRGTGEVFIADISSTIFTGQDGEVRACVIFRDVSAQVAERDRASARAGELERAAMTDELTGLRNRRGFMLAAQQAIAFADREQVPLQLIFLDLDDLKGINDTRGHKVGDAVIQALGRAIGHAVRDVDTAARLGGDEFVVLLYASGPDDAAAIVDRITERFRSERVVPPQTSFSIGLAARPSNSTTPIVELLDIADSNMYQHKTIQRLGRARHTTDRAGPVGDLTDAGAHQQNGPADAAVTARRTP